MLTFNRSFLAAAAMHAMNGVVLGTKQLVVRLHEPKQLRQEKLAARFGGHNNHPRSNSGATSPAASEAGDSFVGWPSPSHRTSALGSPIMGHDRQDNRARRGSGSYYHVCPFYSLHPAMCLTYCDVRRLCQAPSTCPCVMMTLQRFHQLSVKKCSRESSVGESKRWTRFLQRILIISWIR